jgi:hypothetical protein
MFQRANRDHPNNLQKMSKLLSVMKSYFHPNLQPIHPFSSPDMTPPGRVGDVTIKVVSGNQIDLSWAGVKDSDLQGGMYKLIDGQKSPNGKWLSKWNAGGEMGVKTENNNNIFYGFPKTATSSSQTFSSFALSTQKFSDMTLELDMKTYKQLRQNSAPNSWESAWVIWRFVIYSTTTTLCSRQAVLNSERY